jgi:dTDP-4-amino-4,6-dideoxygalactose transaminase
MITKKAENPSNYSRRVVPFQTARQAFAGILRALDIAHGKVLLPAYVGWSPREGSGVFDPIATLHLDYRFYALDDRLRIDLDSLRIALQDGSVRVLVLIHYFGYVDPAYADAVKIAREYDVFVLEDEAHAMLTDAVGGICGRLGDGCLYSFHKLLPVDAGGAAVINDPQSPLAQSIVSGPDCPLPVQFDLQRIASKRRSNSMMLDGMVRESLPEVEPLFGAPACGEFPQSYPVLVPNGSRDRLYHEMNAAGFGVVSLYHTLISQVPPQSFPAAVRVSRRILNLPVHQDVSHEALEAMVSELARQLRRQ